MLKVNLIDLNFRHHPNNSVAFKQTSKYIEWVRDSSTSNSTVFITDRYLTTVDEVTNATRKVAWLLEPRAILPDIYDWIEKNNKKFDFVLTFDDKLLQLNQNFLFYPFGVTWMEKIRDNSPTKTDSVSIIASSKQMTPGHMFRQAIVELCGKRGDVHIYGRGYNTIEKKESGLENYRFSVVAENSIDNFYFSEKIIDCIINKTIPIYWGCDTSKFFDQSGIIKFNSLESLNNILNSLSPELYESMLPAAIRNYEKVLENNLTVPEDWIFANYPFLFNNTYSCKSVQ